MKIAAILTFCLASSPLRWCKAPTKIGPDSTADQLCLTCTTVHLVPSVPLRYSPPICVRCVFSWQGLVHSSAQALSNIHSFLLMVCVCLQLEGAVKGENGFAADDVLRLNRGGRPPMPSIAEDTAQFDAAGTDLRHWTCSLVCSFVHHA